MMGTQTNDLSAHADALRSDYGEPREFTELLCAIYASSHSSSWEPGRKASCWPWEQLSHEPGTRNSFSLHKLFLQHQSVLFFLNFDIKV